MFKIIDKLIFFFKCLYSLFIVIFFKGLIGKELIYYRPEQSNNKNVCTLNDEFELINQADKSIMIVSVKNKSKDTTESLSKSEFGARKNEEQSIIETNKYSNDEVIVKVENTDTILEKSVFDLELKEWNILYNEMMKYIIDKPENADDIATLNQDIT
ncbi:uncharacterized protein LOC112591647 [Melanaphis sacchari]|uniref:uncharacterized protein LOC112591647 n=1 Tax=Melanaphis sacchari TaxID=742174 RepID=UPI000DC15338|nr:uncharacterized protein LOC112591647 [Melanaphis sacchari]